MTSVMEIVMAALAAVGVLALAWHLYGKLLVPVGPEPVFAVVPAAGDGAGLEQTVRGLLWLRGDDLIDYVVVIADCGLDEEGRRMAEVLCRGSGQVRLCAAAQVEQILRERGGGRGP